MILALLEAWIGLTLAFYTDWPTSFWITALGATIYMLAHVKSRPPGVAARVREEHMHGPVLGALAGSPEQKRVSALVEENSRTGAAIVELEP